MVPAAFLDFHDGTGALELGMDLQGLIPGVVQGLHGHKAGAGRGGGFIEIHDLCPPGGAQDQTGTGRGKRRAFALGQTSGVS